MESLKSLILSDLVWNQAKNTSSLSRKCVRVDGRGLFWSEYRPISLGSNPPNKLLMSDVLAFDQEYHVVRSGGRNAVSITRASSEFKWSQTILNKP